MSTETTNRIDPLPVEAAPKGNGNGTKPPSPTRVLPVRLRPEQAATVREYQALLEAVVRAVVTGLDLPKGAQYAGMQGDTMIVRMPSGE